MRKSFGINSYLAAAEVLILQELRGSREMLDTFAPLASSHGGSENETLEVVIGIVFAANFLMVVGGMSACCCGGLARSLP